MKYKEEVRKIYPNAFLYEDTDTKENALGLKFIILNSNIKRKPLRKPYSSIILQKYTALGFWNRSINNAWKDAYNDIITTFIKKLNI